MKRLIVALSIVFIASSFTLPQCYKHHPTSSNIQIDITFDDPTEVVKFEGEQGQGTYTFNPTNTSQSLLNTGTYKITISWDGGCGGFRLSEVNGSNLLLVGPAGGTTSGTGFTLHADGYNAWTNCE